MADTNGRDVIDMTLKNSDLIEKDYAHDAIQPDRLISILGSPGITDFKLKSECATQLLRICSQRLEYEETLLTLLMIIQDGFKKVTADGIN